MCAIRNNTLPPVACRFVVGVPWMDWLWQPVKRNYFWYFHIISNPIYNQIPHLPKILEVVPAGRANRRSNQVKSMYCVVFTVSHLISWHRLNPSLSKQLSCLLNKMQIHLLSSLHQTSNLVSQSQESRTIYCILSQRILELIALHQSCCCLIVFLKLKNEVLQKSKMTEKL